MKTTIKVMTMVVFAVGFGEFMTLWLVETFAGKVVH
jgi:hypothetical protein